MVDDEPAPMLALRKELDPDAPDVIVFPDLAISEREKIAGEIERMYGPHDRRFKTAIEIADRLRIKNK